MKTAPRTEYAFTGLEAAIVLMAFVLVAAVFSYVVLAAGFFTSQKSQETVYKSVEQATSNIQVIGQIYGVSSGPATGAVTSINRIQFTIGLTPGAQPADLTKMTVMFSTGKIAPKIIVFSDTTASTGTFTARNVQTGMSAGSMKSGDQVQINFDIAPIPKNTMMNFEIRPAIGSAYPFTKTTPPDLKHSNVLF